MSPRLLMIVLDGWETRIAAALRAGGRLPALERLAARSARLRLEHGAARRTGLAGEHVGTGLSPEDSGRWSAVDFDPVAYRCEQRGTRATPFPARLGIRSVVFDPPYFDLARAPRVAGIVGWGAHDPGIRHQARPRRLVREIGDYPAERWIYGQVWQSETATKEMGEALVRAADRRAEAARWLLTERLPEWDLGIVTVSEPHSAVEALWHGFDPEHPLHGEPSAPWARDALERTFEAVDRGIDTLVSGCPDTAVLVFSMHGMGPNRSDLGSMCLLGELMYRRRYGRPLLDVPQDECATRLGEDESWPDAVRRHFPRSERAIAAHVSRSRRVRLPEAVRRWLPRGRSTRSPLLWMPHVWYSQHWSDMDAFALPSFYDGRVRINLVGREARGRVAAARYESLRDEIEADVRALTDPRTGDPVVGEVVRPRRDDPRRMGASEADLVFVWQGTAQSFEHPRHGTLGPLPLRRTGGHTGGPGMALFAAPGVKPGDHGLRCAFDVVPSAIEYATGSPARGVSGKSFLPWVS